MALVFRALHPASAVGLLNEEWMILENTGPAALNAAGLAFLVNKKGERPRTLGKLSPGFVMQPGAKYRLISGAPGKKSQGTPPAEEEGITHYYLFLREPLLSAPGLVLRFSQNQMELARATFAPGEPDGLAKAPDPR